MPEAATGGVLWKKTSFETLQNSQETPVPEEKPVNFAKFLTTLYHKTTSGDCFWNADVAKAKREK